PDPESLTQWFRSGRDRHGSPVHHVICESLSYLISMHRQSPKMKSACLIFSDFDDNYPGSDQTRQEMALAFAQYNKVAGDRGAVGCYWVDLAYVPGLTKTLQNAGFKPNKFIVESGINVSPRLPLFD